MNNPQIPNEINELLQVMHGHWLKSGNLNIGQYKSQSQCACGEVLIADGHAEDYRSSMTELFNRHLAAAILAWHHHESAKEREAEQLLLGRAYYLIDALMLGVKHITLSDYSELNDVPIAISKRLAAIKAQGGKG